MLKNIQSRWRNTYSRKLLNLNKNSKNLWHRSVIVPPFPLSLITVMGMNSRQMQTRAQGSISSQLPGEGYATFQVGAGPQHLSSHHSLSHLCFRDSIPGQSDWEVWGSLPLPNPHM